MVRRHLKRAGARRALALAAAAATLVACDRVAELSRGSNPFASFDTRCEALPHTTFNVTASPIVVKRSDELSVAELTKLGPPHFAADRTVGLTRGELSSESNIEVNGVSDPSDGRVCVRPRVQVRLALSPEVYVASEYRDAACRHAALVEHEEKHVAVYQHFLSAAAPRLRAELALALGNKVTYASSMADAQSALKGKVTAVLSSFHVRMQKEIAEAQGMVDTPEEYARVDRQCGGAGVSGAL